MMAKLGEVCEVSPSKKQLSGETFWLLNLDMVEQQTGSVIDYRYVTQDELGGSIIQFDSENVLYSKLRPNLNKVVLPDRDGYATSEMLPLRPDETILTREYLTHFLRSNSFVEWAISKTAGAKMPRLATKELLNKEIPLPSLEEQRRVAGVLDKVAALMDARRTQLTHLDTLIKARFVEMFGDLGENEFGWGLEKLESFCEINPKKNSDGKLQ